MVPRANIPPTRWVRETAKYHNFMVRVEKGNIPRTHVHPAKEKMWRGMGPYTHNCQELCTISIPSTSPRTTIRKTNCWMVTFMGFLMAQKKNPPYRYRIPATLEYLRRYAVDVAYVTQQGSIESQSTYKRRLYNTVHYICRAATESKEMQITNLWPQTA